MRGLHPAWVGYRVLIADDCSDNREVVSGLLAPLGFDLRTAQNGQEAMEQCERWRPHLVILDLRMPDVDGFEVARRLRAAYGAELKIIICSASVASEFREQALAAGADAFLGKPLQADELLKLIAEVSGVKYLEGASEVGPATPATQGEIDLPSSEALRRLPDGLVRALSQAVIAADYEEMLSLVARIASLDERFGGQLRRQVESCDIGSLHHLLATNRGTDAG